MQKAKSEIGTNKDQENVQNKNEPKPEEEDNPSYWEMMIQGIVRPPRAKYNENQLGTQTLIKAKK